MTADDEGDVRGDSIDADRLAQDWEHALDVAGDAVHVSSSAHSLTPTDAAAASEHIRADRNWLQSIRPTVRRLLPRRRR
jgi:hypothetical protein